MNKSILSLCLLSSLLFSADLSRNSNGVVTDSSTSLQWQDNVTSVKKNWVNAIKYCKNLSLDKHNDWILPNKNELLSIADKRKRYPAIKENIFQNITSSNYWSSTTHSSVPSSAWGVYFGYGNTYGNYKDDSLSVRCVRGER